MREATPELAGRLAGPRVGAKEVKSMDISIKEAAELLGKSQRTVRHMAQTGRIPARRIGSRWLIKRADVDAIKAGKKPPSETQASEPTAEAEAAPKPAEHAAPRAPQPRPVAAPRASFTVSFDTSLHHSRRKPNHTAETVRDLDSFTIAAGVLAEVAFLRHQGPCDEVLIGEIERALRGILEVLADGLQQRDAVAKTERFRVAQTRACGALTGLLHYNMVYAEPDLDPISERIEKDLLPALRELIEAIEKRARWRGRAITAAEHAIDRVFTQVRDFAGEGRLGTGLHTIHKTLNRALEAAL